MTCISFIGYVTNKIKHESICCMTKIVQIPSMVSHKHYVSLTGRESAVNLDCEVCFSYTTLVVGIDAHAS